MEVHMREDIIKLVMASRIVLVGSVDGDGFPNVKAMFDTYDRVPDRMCGLKEFWFSSNISSVRTSQWKENAKACVYFFDPATVSGVMLRGTMEILTDDETKLALWKEGDERYYPLGPTDPDYCVPHFTAEDGRYWIHGGKGDIRPQDL